MSGFSGIYGIRPGTSKFCVVIVDGKNFTIVAKTALGLESVVADELRGLGYRGVKSENGELRLDGDFYDVARLNIELRCAERVLLEVLRFKCSNFDDLFSNVSEFAWHELFPKDAKILVSGSVVRSEIKSLRHAQSVVKKAIVTELSRHYSVSRFPETGVPFEVECAFQGAECKIALNTSGDGLHNRGYRTSGGLAPIRETLAAALPLLSRWNYEAPIFDLLCGSGTILIEAASLAEDRAPNAERSFLAERWIHLIGLEFKTARGEAKGRRRQPCPRLVGCDCDEGAIKIARENARNAGVHSVNWEVRDVLKGEPNLPDGALWISNLPYGIRLGNPEQLEALYQRLSSYMRNHRQISFGFVSADERLEKALPRFATRRRKLYNATIKINYSMYDAPKD